MVAPAPWPGICRLLCQVLSLRLDWLTASRRATLAAKLGRRAGEERGAAAASSAGGTASRSTRRTSAAAATPRAGPWCRAYWRRCSSLVFLVSLGLVLRYPRHRRGLALATASVVVKTLVLYAIMVTGSIWEKEVFGR